MEFWTLTGWIIAGVFAVLGAAEPRREDRERERESSTVRVIVLVSNILIDVTVVYVENVGFDHFRSHHACFLDY